VKELNNEATLVVESSMLLSASKPQLCVVIDGESQPLPVSD